jgi:ABC-type uncharacterized transport system fused permease/ATPase subunit
MTPAHAKELLEAVDLAYLADRHGCNTPVQWNEELSLGEQQRLGMARLMFHGPNYAVLDECTSGVSTDMERRFTDILKQLGCTCITISHRPTLVAFHDFVLALDGDGGWQLLPGQRRHHHPSAPATNVLNTISSPIPAGLSGRAADSRSVTAAMAATAGMSAEEEEGGTRREAVLSVLPRPGMAVAAAAGTAWRAVMMAERLRPVRGARAASTWQQWRRVAEVLFSRRSRGELIVEFAGIGAIVVLRTLLQDRIARLNGRTVDLVVQQDQAGFLRLVWVSVLQSLGSSILAPLLKYTTDKLALAWRRRLSEHVHVAYLKENTAVALAQLAHVEDADQRLTAGVAKLSTDLADLVPSLVKPVVDILWFTWSMARLTGTTGLACLYGCAVLRVRHATFMASVLACLYGCAVLRVRHATFMASLKCNPKA